MTRKDYEMLGRIIRAEVEIAREFNNASIRVSAISSVAKSLAGEIALANKAFDAQRFMRDCGLAS